jgi:hypothetical protein
MRHLGWPTRTGCHRGPEQREPQSRVPAGTPGAIVLIKKLRPIRRDHQRRGVASRNLISLAGGHSRPRAPEQSRVPVTAVLTLMPGPELSGAGRAVGGRLLEVLAVLKLYAGRRPADFGGCRDQVVVSLRRPGYARAFSLTTRTSQHRPAVRDLAGYGEAPIWVASSARRRLGAAGGRLACSRRPPSGNGAATTWVTPGVTRSVGWRPSALTSAPACRRSARSRPGCRPGTGSCWCLLTGATVGPGYLKVCYDRKQVKDAPSSDTDGELPAAGEEAIFSTTA